MGPLRIRPALLLSSYVLIPHWRAVGFAAAYAVAFFVVAGGVGIRGTLRLLSSAASFGVRRSVGRGMNITDKIAPIGDGSAVAWWSTEAAILGKRC